MTKYNVKVLQDQKGNAFLPFVTTECVFVNGTKNKNVENLIDEVSDTKVAAEAIARNDADSTLNTRITQIATDAKNHTDTLIDNLSRETSRNIDKAKQDTLSSAKSYTDQEIATAISTEDSVIKSYVDNAIADVTQFDYQIVSDLPRPGKKGTIYLILVSQTDPNYYDEYIWIEPNNVYEKIGSTRTNLDDYYKKNEVDIKLDLKQNIINDLEAIRTGAAKGETALQNYEETDPTVPNHVKAITEEDIAKWNGSSVKEITVIDSLVKMGGTNGFLKSGIYKIEDGGSIQLYRTSSRKTTLSTEPGDLIQITSWSDEVDGDEAYIVWMSALDVPKYYSASGDYNAAYFTSDGQLAKADEKAFNSLTAFNSAQTYNSSSYSLIGVVTKTHNISVKPNKDSAVSESTAFQMEGGMIVIGHSLLFKNGMIDSIRVINLNTNKVIRLGINNNEAVFYYLDDNVDSVACLSDIYEVVGSINNVLATLTTVGGE